MTTPHHPPDHASRMERVWQALDGLSVGDALGSQFFNPQAFEALVEARDVPGGPWGYTDDTEMALAIVEVLGRHGRVDQDDLARTFARRYANDMYRGYGAGAHELLSSVERGTPWQAAAAALFDGQGSMGNGGAMRLAPIGAYFADDFTAVVEQARLSAEVTHSHPEGIAGAVAIALATAWAWRYANGAEPREADRLFALVLDHLPAGLTRKGVEEARQHPLNSEIDWTVYQLGNGAKVTSPDTVPFTLWCVARHPDDYVEALWTTITGRGDIDTNCAIVGGIVALSAGKKAIPPDWLEQREPLDYVGVRGRMVK
jgi:ADP-ribosylglycohydrolase